MVGLTTHGVGRRRFGLPQFPAREGDEVRWNRWALFVPSSRAPGRGRGDPAEAGLLRRCAPRNDDQDESSRTHHALAQPGREQQRDDENRSEEHTSELQSLMRISYAVFCLKKKKRNKHRKTKQNKKKDSTQRY